MTSPVNSIVQRTMLRSSSPQSTFHHNVTASYPKTPSLWSGSKSNATLFLNRERLTWSPSHRNATRFLNKAKPF